MPIVTMLREVLRIRPTGNPERAVDAALTRRRCWVARSRIHSGYSRVDEPERFIAGVCRHDPA